MILDYLGAGASLLSTICYIKQSTWAWPLTIMATLINCILYKNTGIYADMALECFYCLSSIYGYYHWKKHQVKSELNFYIPINLKQLIAITLSVTLLYVAIKFVLLKFTHSNIVTLDALSTALSIIAQCLMCYKFIATWLVWLITDSIYLGLYLIKNLKAHAILMMIYFILALYGYLKWAKFQKLTHSSQLSYKIVD